MKASRTILHIRDAARQRRPVYVNIPDCQEDADPLPGPVSKRFRDNFHHAAIGRGDDRQSVRRNRALRVAEKPKNESANEQQNHPNGIPTEHQRENAEQDRRRCKLVPV